MTLVAAIERKRALIQRGRRPLVGYVSLRNTLAVTELGDRTIVEVDAKTRMLLALPAIVFGPGLAIAFALAPERFLRMPLFIQGVVVVAIAAMTALLVRTLFVKPRFELLANGDIRIGSNSSIARRDVRGVSIETDMYSNSRRVFVPNSVLVLRTGDGDVRLCASPDVALIASLARKAAALTGTDLNPKTTV